MSVPRMKERVEVPPWEQQYHTHPSSQGSVSRTLDHMWSACFRIGSGTLDDPTTATLNLGSVHVKHDTGSAAYLIRQGDASRYK